MSKVLETLTDDLQRFIRRQQMFFVATAPSSDGHVNLSPKGLDGFRIVSPSEVVYQDLTGSGNETSAHLQENGRITIMFCAFQGAPKILRLYGTGRTILPDTPDWDDLSPLFPDLPGARQLIAIALHRVQTSCGYGVPLYSYEGQRDTLLNWAEKKGDDGLTRYQRKNNQVSIDGLPAPIAEQLAQKSS